MSVRYCCYKDCENINIGQVANGQFTLFQFPRDMQRRNQWLELGCVDQNISHSVLLMCSDHFDRKFLSVNPRRTVLVGEAVPYPYGSQNSNENVDEVGTNQVIEIDDMSQDRGYVYFEDSNEQRQDEIRQELQIESTIDEEDNDENIMTYKELMSTAEESSMHDEQEFVNDYVEADNSNSQSNANQVLTIDSSNTFKITEDVEPQSTPNRKRKIHGEENKLKIANIKESTPTISKLQKSVAITSPGKHKMIAAKKMKVSSTLEYKALKTEPTLPDGNNASNYAVDESTLIDPQNVTSFIFKGEEYVQMPKEYFLKEKLELLHKIKQYEKVLKTIQHSVSDFDFCDQT